MWTEQSSQIYLNQRNRNQIICVTFYVNINLKFVINETIIMFIFTCLFSWTLHLVLLEMIIKKELVIITKFEILLSQIYFCSEN